MVETVKRIENIYHLEIGVQGENIANAIQMDMSSWIAEFPSAHIHLLFKPYNSMAPSPMITELDGNILTWYPSFGATAVTGVGYTEVRAIDPDTGLVKKSRIIPTSVENSVTGNETTPPAPYQDWVNSILSARDQIQNAMESASLMNVIDDMLVIDVGSGASGEWSISTFGVAFFGTATFS